MNFIVLCLFVINFPQGFTFTHSRQVKTLNSEQIKELSEGKILKFTTVLKGKDGRHFGWGTSLGVLNSSFEKMKKILLDFEKFPEFLPGLKELRIIKREGNKIKAFHRVKALWMEFKYTLWYTIIEKPESLKIPWVLAEDEKNDLKDTRGYWFITPWSKEKTLLIYSSLVDSGRKAPEVIEKFIMSLTLPRVIKGVRKYLEKVYPKNRTEVKTKTDFGF